MTQKTVELFYDVGSTNSYFALHLLQRLADRYDTRVIYQPFNLGYVFRANNYVLMDEPKSKLINRKRDLMRWAERYNLPFSVPNRFPIKTSLALRGALAARRFNLEQEYLFGVFSSYWEDGNENIDQSDCILAIAKSLGINRDEIAEALDSKNVREALVTATNSALERNIFGAPSIVVGDELFWGKDRMEFVEDELKKQS